MAAASYTRAPLKQVVRHFAFVFPPALVFPQTSVFCLGCSPLMSVCLYVYPSAQEAWLFSCVEFDGLFVRIGSVFSCFSFVPLPPSDIFDAFGCLSIATCLCGSFFSLPRPQDLAVVPLLVAIPLLAGGGGSLAAALTSAATKAAIALGLIAFIGTSWHQICPNALVYFSARKALCCFVFVSIPSRFHSEHAFEPCSFISFF